MDDVSADTSPVTDSSAAAAEPTPAVSPDASDTSAQPAADSGQTATVDTDDLPELETLSKDERARMWKELKALPPDARKTLNAWITQKTQAAAAERKRLAAWADVAESWQKDPEATLQALQQRVPKRAAPAAPQVDPQVLAAVSDRLPEESKPLAPLVAPVVAALFESLSAPVQQFIQQREQEAKMAEAQTILQEFEKERPDWKQYEPVMVEWGSKVAPNPGMTQREYLEALYRLASSDAKVAAAKTERASQVVEKIKKASANAEPDLPSVSPASVSVRKAPTTMQEAYELAKQGIEVQFE